MKIAILGEKKSILGFKALGIDSFGVNGEQDFQEAARTIDKGDYAILFVTEDAAEDYSRELERFYQKTLPAVLIVPGFRKTEGGRQGLRKIVERALGSEMIKI